VAYWALKLVLTPLFRLLWRVSVRGREFVPARGPVILAANHVSFCDSLFLPLVVRRRVTFVAKAEYFQSWKTAWFFRAVGQIPMHREGGSASERALAAAREVLRAGGVLGIYPEGTRSPDGRLYRGHTGVARLALECQVPVVPVGILGTRAVQPVGARLLRPFRSVEVRFGPPLDLRRFAGQGSDPLVLRRLTDELMFEIQQLTGQEYVDRYAKRQGPTPSGAGPVVQQRGSGATPSSPGPGVQTALPASAPASSSDRFPAA